MKINSLTHRTFQPAMSAAMTRGDEGWLQPMLYACKSAAEDEMEPGVLLFGACDAPTIPLGEAIRREIVFTILTDKIDASQFEGISCDAVVAILQKATSTEADPALGVAQTEPEKLRKWEINDPTRIPNSRPSAREYAKDRVRECLARGYTSAQAESEDGLDRYFEQAADYSIHKGVVTITNERVYTDCWMFDFEPLRTELMQEQGLLIAIEADCRQRAGIASPSLVPHPLGVDGASPKPDNRHPLKAVYRLHEDAEYEFLALFTNDGREGDSFPANEHAVKLAAEDAESKHIVIGFTNLRDVTDRLGEDSVREALVSGRAESFVLKQYRIDYDAGPENEDPRPEYIAARNADEAVAAVVDTWDSVPPGIRWLLTAQETANHEVPATVYHVVVGLDGKISTVQQTEGRDAYTVTVGHPDGEDHASVVGSSREDAIRQVLAGYDTSGLAAVSRMHLWTGTDLLHEGGYTAVFNRHHGGITVSLPDGNIEMETLPEASSPTQATAPAQRTGRSRR